MHVVGRVIANDENVMMYGMNLYSRLAVVLRRPPAWIRGPCRWREAQGLSPFAPVIKRIIKHAVREIQCIILCIYLLVGVLPLSKPSIQPCISSRILKERFGSAETLNDKAKYKVFELMRQGSWKDCSTMWERRNMPFRRIRRNMGNAFVYFLSHLKLSTGEMSGR